MPDERPPTRDATRPRVRRRARTSSAIVLLAPIVMLFLAALTPTAHGANFTAGQNADRLLGSSSWTSPLYDDGTKMGYGITYPNGVAVDGSGSVYVADTMSNRVMRWAATPASDGAAMTNVLMKASASQQSWVSTCTNGTNQPEQLSASGDGATLKLAVTDRYNHRVVLFSSEPTTDGATGTVFLGQANGTSCSSNRGGAVAANTLATSASVWTDGTKVAVADTSNNRVLLWNAWPTTGQAADIVLGQADFVSKLANRGGTTAQNNLDAPHGVFFDGTYLYVVDTGNNRVLVWTGWPAANGGNANFVIGQAAYTTSAASCSATGLDYPVAVASTGSGAGHKLAVSVESQRRVLVYTGFQAAPANGFAAGDVLGQANLTTCTRNRGAGTAANNSLRDNNGIAFDGGGALWVADTENHRVLRFAALTTGTAANRVLGHAGATAFTASVPNDGIDDNVFGLGRGTTAAMDGSPVPTIQPDGSLVVADPNQSVVNLWTGGTPASDNVLWNRRLGQSAHEHSGDNGPSKIAAATSMCDPHGTWTDGTRFLLADTCNNRVLAWTTYPSSDVDPADYVLGQANFTSNAVSQGTTGMSLPFGVTSDGTDVYVADSSNDRVIVFRNFWAAPANGTAADVLLGQTTWAASTGATSQTRVNNPDGIDIDQDRLVVSDHDSSRVVIWNNASTLVGLEPIDAIIGQANATNSGIGTITEDTLDVAIEANAVMWVEDCRAFVLDPVPTTGYVTAGASQIGTGCAASPAQNAVNSPSGIDAHAGQVWIGVGEFARLARWTDTTAPTITVAPTASVRCDGTVTVSWSTAESTTTEVYWDTVTRAGVYTAYASSYVDPAFSGLTHSRDLSFATPGTKYAMVRAVDWNTLAVVSAEISFTVPATCPAPTTMLADDANAQLGFGRANPSSTNAPAINSTAFHSSWLQSSGVTMDRYQTETWTTPPEHAGGLWHLDGTGTADANAASSNGITWFGAPAYTTGRFGQAMSFNGTSQHGEITDAASLQKASDFTADLWFRTSTIANNPFPIMLTKSNADCGNLDRCNYSLEWDRGLNTLCASVSTTGNVEIQACRTAVGLLDSQWHYMAMTVSSTNQLRLYVDGALAAGPIAMGAAARTGADPVVIGHGNNNDNDFQGDIDEPRFAPIAYDDAAILGYYRTRRPHAQRVWDSTSSALGANCTTATRCEDHVYAGAPDILRQGARYWQRARYNTLNNDYWTTWGLDWLETTTTTSLSISVGSAISFGVTLPGADAFGSSTVQVSTNGAAGYQLMGRDESDAWGLERLGGGPTVVDWQDGALAPTVWALGTPGYYGVTVRDATGGRLAKWGAGTGWPEMDATNNRYTGLEATSDVLLHERTTYATATDNVVLTWRSSPAASQAAGDYDGVMSLTAVASP